MEALPPLVVRAHRPGRVLGVSVAAVVLLVILLLLAYWFGREGPGSPVAALQSERAGMAAEMEDLRERNAALQDRIAVLERTSQIDREASLQIVETLKSLQDSTLDLREELSFYQDIVGSTARGTGLTVQSMRLRQETEEQSRYRFKLVLTSNARGDTVYEGVVEISVSGQHDGVARRLHLAELSGDPEAKPAFRFSHFQRLEGVLVLPAGFTPQRLSLEISVQSNPKSQLEKSFEWADLFG